MESSYEPSIPKTLYYVTQKDLHYLDRDLNWSKETSLYSSLASSLFCEYCPKFLGNHKVEI